MASGDRQRIINEANSLNKLGNPGAHKEVVRRCRSDLGWSVGMGTAWCACTVSSIFNQAGLGSLIYKSQSVTQVMSGGSLAAGYRLTATELAWINRDHDLGKYGVFKTYNNSNPNKTLLRSLKPGDLVIFKRGISHIGIFVSYNSSTHRLTTIEGNARDAGEGGVRGFSNHLTRTLNKVGGFVIPKFGDSTGVVTDSDSTSITISGIDITPRIVNTNTELREEDISYSNKIWAFYTNNSFKNVSSLVPVGLNPVTSTLGTDVNSIRDMSVMKGSGLGYAIGRALEVWDSPYNNDYGIANDEAGVKSSGKPLVYNRSNKKWYFSEGLEQNSSDTHQYNSYDSYSKIQTPFNSYFGDLKNNSGESDSNKVNWSVINTPEKLLIHMVRKNSRYSYEPAFELQYGDDVTKGFKKNSNGKNIENKNCDAKPGAIAVWANGSISSNSKGMVLGFVEKVKSNNRILVSWSNKISFFFSTWLNPYAFANGSNILDGGSGADSRNRLNSSGLYFWGYIYPPAGVNIYQNYYFLTTGSAVMNWTTDRIWVV